MKFNKKIYATCIVAALVTNSFVGVTKVSAAESQRIYGENRYMTSVEISKSGWEKAEYVVIASGESYADALCSVPLAKLCNSPILLTSSNRLPQEVKKELKRLNPKKIFISGGNGAISEEVEKEIKSIDNMDVERLSGKDRYTTSIVIAEKIRELGGKNSEGVVFASGEGFADALSIAPIAAAKGIPIILSPNDELPQVIKNYLSNEKPTSSYIIGGEGMLSSNVKSSIDSQLSSVSKRLGGKNRYETNIEILKEFKDSIKYDNAYVAIGDKYADALSVAVLAAKYNSPLILTSQSLSNETEDYLKTVVKDNTKVVAIGGETVVPNIIVDTIKKIVDVVKDNGSKKDNKDKKDDKKIDNSSSSESRNSYHKHPEKKSSNAKLKGITINGKAILGFNENTFEYTYELPEDAKKAPIVSAKVKDSEASVEIVQAQSVNGIAKIVVTAEDGKTQKTYKIKFSKIEAPKPEESSNNANLSCITIDGDELEDFNADTLLYNYELKNDVEEAPMVAAETEDSKASLKIVQAKTTTGTAIMVVTSEDGKTNKTYKVKFNKSESPKPEESSNNANLSCIAIDGDELEGFNADTLLYNYELKNDVEEAPMVAAETEDSKASLKIVQAKTTTGTAIMVVTAEDGKTNKTYKVKFNKSESPKPEEKVYGTNPRVEVTGNKAAIVIEHEGDYSVKVVVYDDEEEQLRYIGQENIEYGKCEFKTEFQSGNYTAKVKLGSEKIILIDFTIE